MRPVPPSVDAVPNMRRRVLVATVPAALVGTTMLAACSQAPDTESYESAAARIRRVGAAGGVEGAAIGQGLSRGSGRELASELVRLATLAPSSHNTQCWQFALEDRSIVVRPDLSRRCPAVDPDDHHVFVSLGCAVENLTHAALAHGLQGEAVFGVSPGRTRQAWR